MRRSKGFILAEILISMMLQAGFVIVLCGAFYLLVSFESDVQMKLVARQRGQRVIQYIDQRIRTAGLGFSELKSVSEVQKTLKPFVESSDRPLYNNVKKNLSNIAGLRLPVAISNTQKDSPTETQFRTEANPYNIVNSIVQRGDTLTLLYPKREMDTDVNLVIINKSEINSDDEYIPTYEFISDKYTKNKFSKEADSDKRKKSIENYAVMAGAGEPLYVSEWPSSKTIKLETLAHTPTSAEPIIISGDELLYLKGERIFVSGGNSDRNFVFQELTDDWSTPYYYQDGILEIYFELNTKTNILDLYVLSSGGLDGKIHERPSAWPTNALRPGKWESSSYRYHVVYVSRASWKLDNVPNGFNWNS
ncbi:MAG: hypothetical protein IJQ99_04335 [Synergistaceae bacterium]|nr:hypothetical protein [Synergistaceae bacterium]